MSVHESGSGVGRPHPDSAEVCHFVQLGYAKAEDGMLPSCVSGFEAMLATKHARVRHFVNGKASLLGGRFDIFNFCSEGEGGVRGARKGGGRLFIENFRSRGVFQEGVFFGQPARTNVRRFQCFLPKGNWAEGGGFYIATRVKRFFGSGTVTPGPSCECDITFLLMGGQNLGNNCVTVR